jgi:hypothetical protein
MPLRDRLIAAANPDGGWPYYAGKASRLEPTSWALLALAARSGPPAGAARAQAAHLEFLRRAEDASGWLVDPGSPVANVGWNGLALLALSALGLDADPLATRVTAAVTAAKGVRLADDPAGTITQNNQLQAWAWTSDTFSWVEPTAFCLLALKRRPGARAADVDARIREAELMLLDRVCPHGGWNYGNSTVLYQDLRPYVPTTALALLALQDRPAEPQVQLSLDWLSGHATSERSAMALSLAAVCLAVYRMPARSVVAALGAQAEATGFLDNAHLIAMAQYALTIDDHDAAAFRVARGARRAA